MKITRKGSKVAAGEQLDGNVEVIEEAPIDTMPEVDPIAGAMSDAYNNIMLAIDCLVPVAENDPLVQEAIANLSVVAFSLK